MNGSGGYWSSHSVRVGVCGVVKSDNGVIGKGGKAAEID